MSQMTLQQVMDVAVRHHTAGQLHQAERLYQQVLSIQPNYADALHLLGLVTAASGRADEGIALIRRALQVHPTAVEYWSNLGILSTQHGKAEDAIAAFQEVVELKPDAPDYLDRLGFAFQQGRRPEEAVIAYRRAMHIRANSAVAVRVNPTDSELLACDNLLNLIHNDAANDARAIYDDHAMWNRIYAAPLSVNIARHDNDVTPGRRLRVGYVSAYLNSRPVGRFLSGLLANHNHEQFEVFCYSDLREPDAMTASLRGCADSWRDTANLTHEQLAELIRSDRIDILIDLGMHATGNRMLTFARKPAPLQVTYLAYCSTTGLQTIDYRASDACFDPDDSLQPYYSEKTIRLQSYWCYPLPVEAPAVGPLPALACANAPLTFGCLNDFRKVNAHTLSLWADVLRSVQNSRLHLYAPNAADTARPLRALVELGVDANRISFVGWAPIGGYFGHYNQIDIALDTTPWCGGTTTCDALWMGVPVVSLAGHTAISRGGRSILSQIGLQQLVADNAQHYVDIASHLAHDLPRLAEMRNTLRNRTRSSRLMDAPAFTRDFEAVLRKIWNNWCEQLPVVH